MPKRRLVGIFGTAVLAIGVGYYCYYSYTGHSPEKPTSVPVSPEDPQQQMTAVMMTAQQSAPADAAVVLKPKEPTDTPEEETQEIIEEPGYSFDTEAIAAMREARLHGDPRTPPLARQPQQESPTPEELADPDLYLAYEARQTTRVYRNFVYASEIKIEKLTKLVEQARAMGLDEATIQEGEEKIQKLREAQAKLLAEHEDIL